MDKHRQSGLSLKLILLLILGLIATACGGEAGVGNSAETTITGPAFILFFTDP